MSGPASPAWTTERARLAGLRRCRPADDPVVLEARRDLRAAKLATHIERCVAEAPPLTSEQLDRLALLLRPAQGAA
jgi:hypothetical protein